MSGNASVEAEHIFTLPKTVVRGTSRKLQIILM